MKEAEIRALARMLDRLDYYRLLQIDAGAPAPEIRAAYHRMRRGFHPDAFHDGSDELRQAVAQISKRVNEGYVVLRDARRRAAYDKSLAQGALRYTAETEEQRRSESEALCGTTANGKRLFSLAQTAEKSGDLVAAISNLKMALTFEPQNEHFKQKLEALKAQVPDKPKSSNPYAIR